MTFAQWAACNYLTLREYAMRAGDARLIARDMIEELGLPYVNAIVAAAIINERK